MIKLRRHSIKEILFWLLLIILSIEVAFLVMYATHEAYYYSRTIIFAEQDKHNVDLRQHISDLNDRLDKTESQLQPIFEERKLTTEEKAAIIVNLRHLESLRDTLSRSIDRYDNDLTIFIFDGRKLSIDDQFARARQTVVHTGRLLRIIDLLLLMPRVSHEQREILIDHLLSARWSLERVIIVPLDIAAVKDNMCHLP